MLVKVVDDSVGPLTEPQPQLITIAVRGKRFILKPAFALLKGNTGQGLGKEKNGITKAIRANLKFDKAGMGYCPSLEFTDKWWENIYNDALNHKTISLKRETKFEREGNQDCTNTASAQVKFDQSTDLFEACGGRTAHKGARHGLQLSGKLERLAQQEQLLLNSNKPPEKAAPTNQLKSSEKTKKKKRKCTVIDSNEMFKDEGEIAVKVKERKKKIKCTDSENSVILSVNKRISLNKKQSEIVTEVKKKNKSESTHNVSEIPSVC